MLWFRYRWVFTFSHGLCVKIIRGSEVIKNLELELKGLSNMPLNLQVGEAMLDRLLRLINILDDVIFSASALMYREEKDLVKFIKRAEVAAERLIKRLRKEKGRYEKDAVKLKDMLDELRKKKQQLPRRFERGVQIEKERVVKDEERRKDYVNLLNELTSFIEEVDNKIHNVNLEAKAQKRRTLNRYMLKENVIIRSNFRLGELTGRKGIEADVLIKKIRKKLRHFVRIVGSKERLDINQVKELFKYCRMEANDLENAFVFLIQVSERVEGRLNRLAAIIAKNPGLKSLTNKYLTVRKRLNELRDDIQAQHKRLNNEVKRAKIISLRQVIEELKQAA